MDDGAMDIYGACAAEVNTYFQGLKGTLLSNPIDTDIDRLVTNSLHILKQESLITADFDDGTDPRYNRFLICAYNASLDDESYLKWIEKARQIYDSIPPRSKSKAIARIQLTLIDPFFGSKMNMVFPNDGRSKFLESFDQITAFVNACALSYSARERVITYECLGDLYRNYGLLGHALNIYNYSHSLLYRTSRDSTWCMLNARLKEKIIKTCMVESPRSETYAKYGEARASQRTSVPIRELAAHNMRLGIEYGFGTETDALAMLACELGRGRKELLATDVSYLIYKYMKWAGRMGKKGLAERAAILNLNYIVENNLKDATIIESIEELINASMERHNLPQAMAINQHVFSQSCGKGDYLYAQYLLNTARMFYSMGAYPEASDMLHKLDTQSMVIYRHDRTFRNANEALELYEKISMATNDVQMLQKVRQFDEKLRDKRSYDFAGNASFLSDLIRDVKDDSLRYSIFFLRTLSEQQKIIKMKDSVNNQNTRKILNDSINAAKTNLMFQEFRNKTEVDALKRTISTIMIIAIVGLVITVLFVLVRGRFIRQQRRTLEMDSIMAGYLGHGVGGTFQHLVGLLDEDTPESIESTRGIVKEVSILYRDLQLGLGKPTNLLHEIEQNERYAQVVSLGEDHPVTCRNELDRNWAQTVNVPRFFLLDIYSNALKHGHLGDKAGGEIIARQVAVKGEKGCCFLVVENNGIGREEAELYKKDLNHKSTGMKRVMKMLKLLKQKNAYISLLDKEGPRDVIRDGVVYGTKVTFKIKMK
ncbi:MAG: hypothetical protein JST90_14660 [Bacteroidetes bacterium]|nr:hypothetical protein [Bacteroidota bacterium]